MCDTDSSGVLEAVQRRGDILVQLLSGEHSPTALDHHLDHSRRTIGRALDEFEAEGAVVREDDSNCVELTHYGRKLAWARCEFVTHVGDIADASPILRRLPEEAPLDCAMMEDATINVEPEAAPESAWEPVDRAVNAGDDVKGVAPRVTRSYVSTFYEQIVENDTAVELVLPSKVFASIIKSYDREWQAAITADNCWFGSYDSVPPFGMLIVDESEVWIGVYRSDGSALAGTVFNDSPDAVERALEIYNHCRENATHVLPVSSG